MSITWRFCLPPSRKPRRRRVALNPNYVPIKIATQVSLGTLANDTAITVSLWDLNDDVKVMAAELWFAMQGHTPGEGPLEMGIAKGYTAAQILECVDASPASRSDDIQIERSRRKVRRMATLPGLLSEEVPNNGLPIWKRKLFWKIANDDDMVAWIVNRSGAALQTGTVIDISGTIHAVWA